MEKTLLIEILIVLTFFIIAGHLFYRALLLSTPAGLTSILLVSALLSDILPIALIENAKGTPTHISDRTGTIYVYNVLVDEIHGQMFLTARRASSNELLFYRMSIDKGLAEKIQKAFEGGEMFVPIEGDYSESSGDFVYHVAPYTEDPPKEGETE